MTATCSGSGLRSAFATFAPSLRPRKLALRRPSRRRLLSTEAGNGNGSGSGNNALIAELESRGLLQAMTRFA